MTLFLTKAFFEIDEKRLLIEGLKMKTISLFPYEATNVPPH